MGLKSKYYREEGEEYCFPLQYFIDEDPEPVILIEMRRDIGGEMWCVEIMDFVDDMCGRDCKDYKPCNGVSGRCRRLKHGFLETENKYILKDGLLTPMDKK